MGAHFEVAVRGSEGEKFYRMRLFDGQLACPMATSYVKRKM